MAHTIDLRKKKEAPQQQTPQPPIKEPVRLTEKLMRAKAVAPIPQKRESLPRSFSWQFRPSRHLKHELWFVIGALAGLGMFFWVWQENALVGLICILALVVYVLMRKEYEDVVRVQVSDAGVQLNTILIPYSQLVSYWVEYNPGGLKELSLEIKRWYLPYVKLPLADQDPVALRNRLALFLPEEEHEPSLIDAILYRIVR